MAPSRSSTRFLKGRLCLQQRWSLSEIEVPTVEHCVREDAIEAQDIRELVMGWAWFVNDLRAFLPAWQDMELASPFLEEPDPFAPPRGMDLMVAEQHTRHTSATASVLPSGREEVRPPFQKRDIHAKHPWLRDLSLCKNFLEQEEEYEGRKAELEVKQQREQAQALRQLLCDFEEHMEREIHEHDDHVSLSSTEVEEQVPEQDTLLEVSHAMTAIPEEDMRDDGTQFLGRSLSSFYAMIGSCRWKS